MSRPSMYSDQSGPSLCNICSLNRVGCNLHMIQSSLSPVGPEADRTFNPVSKLESKNIGLNKSYKLSKYQGVVLLPGITSLCIWWFVLSYTGLILQLCVTRYVIMHISSLCIICSVQEYMYHPVLGLYSPSAEILASVLTTCSVDWLIIVVF